MQGLRLTVMYIGMFVFARALQSHDVALVIFSKGRPLQLYALLESIHDQVRGLSQITVLYHAQNDAYAAGYEVVKRSFPCVRFVRQSRDNPRGDFYYHLVSIIKGISSQYIMFAVDDMVAIRPIDTDICVQALRISGAYAMYLRLGSDITACYNLYGQSTPPPQRQPVLHDISSWVIDKERGDWSWYHTVDMAIYTRDMILAHLYYVRDAGVCTPNTFEDRWMCIPLPCNAKGLCYEESRVINIPINMVQTDWSMRCMQTEEYSAHALLHMFQNGYRAQVKSLYGMVHHTVHVDCKLPLERRTV